MSEIERSEGWKISVIRGNPGRLSGGEMITFRGTGRIHVDRPGTDWNDIPWDGSTPVATGKLPDNRPFTVTLTDTPPGQPRLECRIGLPVPEPGRRNDLDGESGGWTAQEGESPVGGPGRGKWRWRWKKR